MPFDTRTDGDAQASKMHWKVRDLIVTLVVMLFLSLLFGWIIERIGFSKNIIVESYAQIIVTTVGIALLNRKYPLRLFGDIDKQRVIKYLFIGAVVELLFSLPNLTLSPENLKGTSKDYMMTYIKLAPFEKKLYILFLCLLGPTFEEILWRGFVYRILRNRYNILFGALVSSALFAIIHRYDYRQTIIMGVIALFWVYLYEKSKSILPSITAHIAGNTLLFALTYWTSKGH